MLIPSFHGIQCHRSLRFRVQVTGVILSTIAVSIAINKFQVTTWDNTHVKLGLAIMILVWLHTLLAVVRPRR